MGLFNFLKKKDNAGKETIQEQISTQGGTDHPYLPKVGKRHSIVGLKYRKENVLKLARENPNYKLTRDQIIKRGLTDTNIHKYLFINGPVVLEQEPTNPKDSNAIKVIVAGQHIGYIKAGSCAQLNKVINEGRIEKILCRISGGPSIGFYSATDEDTGKPCFDMRKDNLDFFAEIRIVEKDVK